MTDAPERIARIIRENLSGVTSTDTDIRAAQEDDLMRTANLIAADLCASGQQVRALEWEQVDPTAVLGHGIEPCQYYIRYEVGSWWMPGDAEVEDAQEFDDLEAAKAAAQADYERRILAALTPAPQAEGLDNPSGMACTACRSVGVWHCSDPENCGGMKPMRSACTCNEPWCKACAPAPSAATPTAQEAVPVAWKSVERKFYRSEWQLAKLLEARNGGLVTDEGEAWVYRYTHKDGVGGEYDMLIRREPVAHPPQPSETVAEALRDLLHAVCGETGFAACVRHDSGLAYPWPALDEAEKNARAALRALKGSDQ